MRMIGVLGRSRLLLTLVVSAGLLAGCADLMAIREFASTSTEAAQYRKIVVDYIEMPSRVAARYVPAEQRARWDELGQRRKALEPRLFTFQQVVAQYMDSLGQLAADELVAYDKELEGLSAAVKDAKFLQGDEADAVNALVKLVLNAAADAWRRRQLHRLIEHSNAPFQLVVGALRRSVADGFAGSLQDEVEAMRKHYEGLVRDSKDPAGIAALREWETLRRGDITDREAAVRNYMTVLDRIAAGHDALYRSRGDLSNKQLLADMHRYASEIKAAFAAVRALK